MIDNTTGSSSTCKKCEEPLEDEDTQECAECGVEAHANCMEYVRTLKAQLHGDPGNCYPEEGIDLCGSCFQRLETAREDAAERRAEDRHWRDYADERG